MVSCYLTRVILNVSVALTVTCYKPDGSVYNKTVCSLLPSNMAKLEILKDMFREKNMSIPDNLVTTPVVLLEPDSAEDDFYVDNENWKIKANKKSKGVRPTRIHPYSVMAKNSQEFILRKAKSMNKYTPEGLELRFNTEYTTPLRIRESHEPTDVTGDPNATGDPNETGDPNATGDLYVTGDPNTTGDREVSREQIDITEGTRKSRAPDDSHKETTKYLSLHDQLALSLERQMKIIDDYEEAVKANKTLEAQQATEQEEESTTVHEFYNDNVTHHLSKNMNNYLNKYASLKRLRSLSEEIARHERIAASLQNIMDEANRDNPVTYYQHDKRTLNTDHLRYQYERKGSHGEEEEEQSTISLADRVDFINKCMNQQRNHYAPDVTTKLNNEPNRIEKRSIPNTNDANYDKSEKQVTTEKSNDSNMMSENESAETANPLFPGPDNFWNVFVTSPVEVILNSTSVYDKKRSLSTMADYEKEYYENLVKTLKEKYTEPVANASTKRSELQTEQSTLNTEQSKLTSNEDVSNMIEQMPMPAAIEMHLENIRKRGEIVGGLGGSRERMNPEKYAEYVQLKRALDHQYKDIKTHLNNTDREIQRLYIEMRALRKEKVLHDYYEENEHLFEHLTTPSYYTNTLVVMNNNITPISTMFPKRNTTEVTEGKVDFTRPTDSDDDDRGPDYELLDNVQSFKITNPPDSEQNSDLKHSYYQTTQVAINNKEDVTLKNPEKYDYASLERYDKKKFDDIIRMELEHEHGDIGPNISRAHIDLVHAKIMKRLNLTRTTFTQKPTNTETHRPWFEESVFDQNDPKILYAKYLHNVRNMSVKLNMEVGKKQMTSISYFNKDDRQYAHQYKSTTECRRFSHIIPFWLTQPKEIEDVFKGNTKIFREYIQYILDKHNFTELPVHGRFAFLRDWINKLNNPLIFNRITIFPTAYVPTRPHKLSLKDQIKHFKGNLKSKIHRAYKHVKHFLFNSSVEEVHDPVPIAITEPIPDEVIINITTPPPMGYYDYYD
ncbi:hypothetical protein M8J76_004754 [Diaphorina citri]|nr:hypothetical protein M8J76_004754 [Diaphorina citri]